MTKHFKINENALKATEKALQIADGRIFQSNIFYNDNNLLFEFLAKCFKLDLCELISEYKSRAGERESLESLADTLNFLVRSGEEFSEFAIFTKKHEVEIQSFKDQDGGIYCYYVFNSLLNGFYYKEERREWAEDENGEPYPVENSYFISYEQEELEYLSKENYLTTAELEKIA